MVTDDELGLKTTSTGTSDAARVAARSVSAGEVAVAALLCSAQYPTVPLPGPRTTTWPGIRWAMLAGSVQPVSLVLVAEVTEGVDPTPR